MYLLSRDNGGMMVDSAGVAVMTVGKAKRSAFKTKNHPKRLFQQQPPLA